MTYAPATVPHPTPYPARKGVKRIYIYHREAAAGAAAGGVDQVAAKGLNNSANLLKINLLFS